MVDCYRMRIILHIVKNGKGNYLSLFEYYRNNEVKMRSDYEMIIGLEVHVELSSKTKIFCSCPTDFGAPVNTHICPVCMGMPGALPVLNKEVLRDAVSTSLALNCNVNKSFRFDRKNYFYPDNPQNYQISQLYSPIGVNGYIDIGDKRVRIHELHMEEDAGKLIHENGETLIDFNRAGVPLLEIVSEPDIRSAEEAVEYLKSLRAILICLGVSDCRMNEGSLRADVNLSVRKIDKYDKPAGSADAGEEQAAGSADGREKQHAESTDERNVQQSEEQTTNKNLSSYEGDEHGLFGTRTEMKNLNSFKAVLRAIEHESGRQIDLLEQGREVDQETRRWDDTEGSSFVMRSKEDAMDYRYFPDPDLPIYTINDDYINEIKIARPELPSDKAKRYISEYGLSERDTGIIVSEKTISDIFEKTVTLGAKPKAVSNWLLGETMRIMNERNTEADDLKVSPECLYDLIELQEKHVINSTTAKEVFEKIFDGEIGDVKRYVDENSLGMVTDNDALSKVIEAVLEANPEPVADYHAGKTKAIGFLIGQVMKEMKGKADPELARELLIGKLG